MAEDEEVLFRGRFLELRRKLPAWEYATRANARGCVAILAITDQDEVILTEQYRPPMSCEVIELPAGLLGDEPGLEDEALLGSAQRELREETGYEAREWTLLMEGASSAGLTDECAALYLAEGLTKVSAGGGVAGENIRIHLVPVSEVYSWCRDRQGEGKAVDFKIFAGLWLANAKKS